MKQKKIITVFLILIFLLLAVFPAAAVEITEELEDALDTGALENAVPDSAKEIIGRAEIETGEGQKRLLEEIWNYIKEDRLV